MSTIEQTSAERRREYERRQRTRQNTALRGRDRRGSEGSASPERRKIRFSLLSIGKGLDVPFVLIILVLLVIGLTMMFSASYPVAYYELGDSYYYLKRQLIFAVIGLAVMIAISYVDYHYYHRFSALILGVSYLALVLVLIMPAQEGGVHRWIGIGDVFGIQASE
ncbi:MAG: FtsW/RodA/SpoVE family cell cycle protein, partial [Ruminococcus sp.]|nr:FtsW/RodA/SpoVE family cell cycle protein [Ruminococcus sp.]